MRRRIYIDGKPSWSENEPDCRARPVGFGGQALGSVVAPTVVVAAPRKRLPRAPLNRARVVCGAWLPLVKEPCARTAGHKDSHRSSHALNDDAARRRTGLPYMRGSAA